MTTRSRAARVVSSVALLLSVSPTLLAQAPLTRTLYVSVTGKDGRPVLDMEAGDFEIKENGRRQEATVRLATAPLRVALIVADHGSGAFQGGALRFCEALLGQAAISLVGLIVQPERLTGYTTSGDTLAEGLRQLGRRRAATEPGAQLTEAVYETARAIPQGSRSAIVAMRAGAEASGSVRIDQVQDAIRNSGAVFYVVSTTTSDYRTGAVSVVQTVLNDSTRESGGRRIDVVAGTLVPTMQQVAAELVNQYEIRYILAPDARPNGRVSVATRRTGVTVHAPTRIAN